MNENNTKHGLCLNTAHHSAGSKARQCSLTGTLRSFTQSLKAAAASAKAHQSCPTLCDPTDGGPPGSSVPGILQGRTLEWGHFLLQCVKVKSLRL